MLVDKISELESQLQKILLDYVENPDERGKLYGALKNYNTVVIKAVINDFEKTLNSKRDEILANLPIENNK